MSGLGGVAAVLDSMAAIGENGGEAP